MVRDGQDWIHAGTLADLERRGCVVVKGRRCPILVLSSGGEVHALDNRCPHLGFPLDRGTVEDGILTCHWHHARFDITSGGTFDPWADDVPTAEVRIENGDVWVASACRLAAGPDHHRRRLGEGMEHNIGLVIAKSVLGALGAGHDARELVRDATLFGARYRDGWGTGLTILTALANLIPKLGDEETYLALYQGIRRVAADCDGAVPRRARRPLDGAAVSLDALKRWLRQWTMVRHRDGAERTVLTAIEQGAGPRPLADLMLSAVTDRCFADGGHALDFTNKAFECLDLVGWEHAAAILPTVVGEMVTARGGEETDAWRHPLDLVPLLEDAFARLPDHWSAGVARRGGYDAHRALAESLLGDDPAVVVEALNGAIRDGATAADLGRGLAFAAALRVARFGTSNEFSDWDTTHHTFTYANALHQLLKRATDGAEPTTRSLNDGVRGVYHGAMALYLTRYLNVPPAALPGEGRDPRDEHAEDPDRLLAELLGSFDRRDRIEDGAALVARYLDLNRPLKPLLNTLALALLREDAGFHAFQMLEAAVRQYGEWGASPEGRAILVAATRFLAAHSPTERRQFQTARIARRLYRGEPVHGDGASPAGRDAP